MKSWSEVIQMDIQNLLSQTPAKEFKIREKRAGIYQLIAPLFYSDGDMMNIYLQNTESGQIKLCDYGETLMRLSYLFDIDTDKKRSILVDTITSRNAEMLDGSIEMQATPERLFEKIMAYSQLLTEVSSMDMLAHENIEQLFYDNLREAVYQFHLKAEIRQDYTPHGYPDVRVDYAFFLEHTARPIFLFGIKDNNKAQQSTIHCLNLTLEKVPHKSIAVFEDTEKISRFARKSLINAAGKVFDGLPGFTEKGEAYIETELQSA